jgi:hypothetical protein
MEKETHPNQREGFMQQTRIHPVTGVSLTRDMRPFEVTIGDRLETVQLPGWYPAGDGDSIHSGADSHDVDDAIKRVREQQPHFRLKQRGRTDD